MIAIINNTEVLYPGSTSKVIETPHLSNMPELNLQKIFISFKVVSLECIFTTLTGNAVFAQNIFRASLTKLSSEPGAHFFEQPLW